MPAAEVVPAPPPVAEPQTVRTLRPTARKTAVGRIPAYWILVLAVLLGLATGSVIGLITLF